MVASARELSARAVIGRAHVFVCDSGRERESEREREKEFVCAFV